MTDVQEIGGREVRQGSRWQHWISYFSTVLAEGRKQVLDGTNYRTPGHALAQWKAERYGMTEDEAQEYVDHFGPLFDAVRPYAIERIRASGKSVAIIMDTDNQRKIGRISLEPDDQEDSLARDAKMAVGKLRLTEGRVKLAGLSDDQRRGIGWLAPPTVKQIEEEIH